MIRKKSYKMLKVYNIHIAVFLQGVSHRIIWRKCSRRSFLIFHFMFAAHFPCVHVSLQYGFI